MGIQNLFTLKNVLYEFFLHEKKDAAAGSTYDRNYFDVVFEPDRGTKRT